MRKLVGIKEVPEFDLYDITVDVEHNFVLDNGVIAHNSLYPKDIVGGGTGAYYNANDIWIIGRSQEKNDKTGNIDGYTFTIKIEKSRKVKEASKIPVTVMFGEGIDQYSSIAELALEGGFIEKPSMGWYQLKGTEEKVRMSAINPLLDKVLADPEFAKFVENKFKMV